MNEFEIVNQRSYIMEKRIVYCNDANCDCDCHKGTSYRRGHTIG